MDRRIILILGMSGGLLATVGCGPRSVSPPATFAPTGTAGAVLQPLNSGSVSPTTLTAMMGNYGGTVVKTPVSGSTQTQAYTFTLAQAPDSTGALVGTLNFSSNGSIGSVAFQTEMKLWNTMQNGYDTDGQPLVVYTLDSAMVKAPALTDDPEVFMQVRLTISIKNNTTFVPTQSQIYFRDCVFAPSQPCMVMPYVRSGNDLAKR